MEGILQVKAEDNRRNPEGARFPGIVLVLTLALVGVAPTSAQKPRSATVQQTPGEVVAVADEVSKEVEALRGWTFKRPVKKELTTVAELMKYVSRQVDESMPGGREAEVQAFLRTIGLLPADVGLKKMWLALLENQVGGFYDTDTKSMHLIARPGVPPLVERILLAHELTHALDDQYADLDLFVKERLKGTEDLDIVANSVVEGSATALMLQYMTRMLLSGRFDQKQLMDYAQEEQERSKPFLNAPRYFSAMLASYICGAQFLARGQLVALMAAPDDKAVGDALLTARKDPPRSSEQILHPSKYWDATARDEPVIIDDQAAERWLSRPDRWIVHTNTVGEMLTAILTSPPGTRPDLTALQSADAWTNTAAAGWGGDRFYLLAAGANAEAARKSLGKLQGVWVTTWDTAKDRDEFVQAMPLGSAAKGNTVVAVSDKMAVVYFGFTTAERDALTRKLHEQPLKMTKGGRPFSM